MDPAKPTRSLAELETDIANISAALVTVSDLRSSLRSFAALIEDENRTSSFVQQFTERLTNLREGLGRLSLESESLRGALDYAQSAANAKYDWENIKANLDSGEAGEDGANLVENKNKEAEAGSIIQRDAERIHKELSSVVMERSTPLTSQSSTKNIITSFIKDWFTNEKAENINVSIESDSEEREASTGSACSITIQVAQALKASLDMEYHKASDSLIIHRYGIDAVSEKAPLEHDSRYLLFQKLNILADAAFQDMSVLPARESFMSIMNWISSYHNLFTEPCVRCHKRLQLDSPQYKHLPPMVRTWVRRKIDYMEPDREMPQAYTTAGIAYHMQCFVGATKVAAKS
ncbi:hypothetical protein VTP01DRAFT_2201 [Rhizomucor pusillus]|uniref:uncharacterized protein n=1 Tax=Rhizomucor pusillus TaxID=4840 RepID=UPI0037422C13